MRIPLSALLPRWMALFLRFVLLLEAAFFTSDAWAATTYRNTPPPGNPPGCTSLYLAFAPYTNNTPGPVSVRIRRRYPPTYTGVACTSIGVDVWTGTVQVGQSVQLYRGTYSYKTGTYNGYEEEVIPTSLPNSYTITASVTPVGWGTVSPTSTTVNSGGSTTISASCVYPYLFDSWTVDGATNTSTAGHDTTTSSYTFSNVTANHAIVGVFKPRTTRRLTLTSNGPGSGSLTSNPSQITFYDGDAVTVTATANANSYFAGWSDGGAAQHVITMNSDKTLTATFNLNVATVTVNSATYTCDGAAKSLSASTNPGGLSYSMTYNGSGTAPWAAGIYNAVATITAANWSGSGSGTLTISKATPSVSFPGTSTTVGQAVTLAATRSGGVSPSGGLTYNVVAGAGTISGDRFTPTAVGAGSATLQASYAGDGNNNGASATAAVSIAKASPAVSFPGSSTAVGQAVDLGAYVTGGYNPTGGVTYALVSGSGTLSGATFTPSAVGTGSATIRASYGGDSNNNAASSTAIVTIAKASPSVPFPPASATVGQAVTLGASVSGGYVPSGGVTYALLTGSGSLSGSTFTPSAVGTGSATIRASYAGDGNNNGATNTGAVAIAKASPSISFNGDSSTLVGQTIALSAKLVGGYSPTGGITYTVVSGGGTLVGSNFTSTAAGAVVIRASYAGDANNNGASAAVTFTFGKASPSVSFPPASTTVGQGIALGASVVGGFNPSGGLTYTVVSGTGTISGGTFTPTAVGTGSATIRASYGGDANNNPASQTTTVAIAKASPTLSFPTVPSTYGQPTTLGASVVGGYGPVGAITYTLISGSGTIVDSTFTPTAVGSGTATLRATFGGDANNNSATRDTDFAVSKASQTVTISPASATIAAQQTTTFSAAGSNTGYVWGGAGSGSGTTQAITFPLPGDYSVTVYGPADANYLQSNTATATVKVTPLGQGVTLSPPSTSISAGGSATFSASGGINGYRWGGVASGEGVSKTIDFALPGRFDVTAFSPAGGAYEQSNTASATVTVNAVAQTVEVSPAAALIEPNQPVQLSARGGKNGYVWSGSASGSGDTKTLTFAAPGRYGATVLSPAGGAFLQSNAATAQLTVAYAQTINFPPPGSFVLRLGGINLVATASSGLPVRFTVIAGPGLLNGVRTLQFGSVGAIVVQADQDGDASYAPALSVRQTVYVNDPADTSLQFPDSKTGLIHADHHDTNLTLPAKP